MTVIVLKVAAALALVLLGGLIGYEVRRQRGVQEVRNDLTQSVNAMQAQVDDRVQNLRAQVADAQRRTERRLDKILDEAVGEDGNDSFDPTGRLDK